ncbi:MAG: hypothetical protein COA78_02140 [Blastopirellula sp.]|nr:MAG: hypothetical protein COA78_02140 [Blastopirellula sp.]
MIRITVSAQTNKSKIASPLGSRLLRNALLIVCLLGSFSYAIAETIFKVEVDQGILVVEVTGEDFETRVHGTQVKFINTKTKAVFEIQLRTKKTIQRLAKGEYQFDVTTSSGLKFQSDKFTIRSGKDSKINVHWEPKAKPRTKTRPPKIKPKKVDIQPAFPLMFSGQKVESKAITVDQSGNIYTTGLFRGAVDFDSGLEEQFLKNLRGSVYITKHDALGKLIWVKTIGASNTYGIAVDISGNVYVTGYYLNSSNFDPGPETNILKSNGKFDVYLVSLDSHGKFRWAKTMGGKGYEYGHDVAVDKTGNVFLTGRIEEAVQFGPDLGNVSFTSHGKIDIFIMSLDRNGKFRWVKHMGGKSTDIPHAMAVDHRGNVFVTGRFSEAVDFDPGPNMTMLESSGGDDIFIVSLDNHGEFRWAKRMGGSTADTATDIAVDYQGNLYLTGDFWTSADFDPSKNIARLESSGAEDIFIVSLDNNGNYRWANKLGGKPNDRGTSVAVGRSGIVFATGYYRGELVVDIRGEKKHLKSEGETDILVYALNSKGEFLWVNSFGGRAADTSSGIAFDNAAHIYVTGTIKGTVDAPHNPKHPFLLKGEQGMTAITYKLTVRGDVVESIKSLKSAKTEVSKFATIQNSIGMKFNPIQPGTFRMGDGVDAHQVIMTKPFHMGIYEVTQAEHQRIMGTRYTNVSNYLPRGSVIWSNAAEFCQKLSDLPEEKSAGRSYRLPTEAEWEYACRAGSTTKYYFGDDDKELIQYAWHDDGSSSRSLHPVGLKEPNAWGMYDMLGNVGEWCQDWYGTYPFGPITDPQGPKSGSVKVVRGGSYMFDSTRCQPGTRVGANPRYNGENQGFRVVMELAK